MTSGVRSIYRPALLRVSAAEPSPTRGTDSETDGRAGVITVALRCGVSVINWPFSPLYHLATLHVSAVSLPGKAMWHASRYLFGAVYFNSSEAVTVLRSIRLNIL